MKYLRICILIIGYVFLSTGCSGYEQIIRDRKLPDEGCVFYPRAILKPETHEYEVGLRIKCLFDKDKEENN
jgi:hypothetical protein